MAGKSCGSYGSPFLHQRQAVEGFALRNGPVFFLVFEFANTTWPMHRLESFSVLWTLCSFPNMSLRLLRRVPSDYRTVVLG